ncbi:pilus assembly protein [Jatrophihabitans telluris]|uniref:Pilus assembly protein n=1 Tax=Jatrophihabitans telluris TaxID=2038343 RepID=A0ABY4R1W2_9ACTN|nr:TadE/TadG family type IV pilus assembly protein [Jatrophihabitans telluris]UQX89507.1 pilus assembly protein [Jatrophihabitans telluris]
MSKRSKAPGISGVVRELARRRSYPASRTEAAPDAADRGAAVTEFVLVLVLLLTLLFAVLQLAAVLYIKSMAAAAAADGARYGANANVEPSAGPARANELLRTAVGAQTSSALTCSGGASVDRASGLATESVACHGKIRSLFVPAGAFVTIDTRAEALRESP